MVAYTKPQHRMFLLLTESRSYVNFVSFSYKESRDIMYVNLDGKNCKLIIYSITECLHLCN